MSGAHPGLGSVQIELDEVRYQFMCQMAERIVAAGGLIFGGFLRDKLIRDHYSADYKKRKEKEGPVADVDTSARTTLPQNLNVIFVGNAQDLQVFYEEIVKDDVELVSKVDNRPHPFLQQGFRHASNLIMKNSQRIVGKPIKLQLDLLVSTNPVELLWSEHDLDCNVLICDREGIRTSFDPKVEGSVFNKFARQQEIIKRILDRKTAVLPVDEGKPSSHLQSALKMMLRGWTVTNVSSFQIVGPCAAVPIGLCLFCQGEIQEKAVHINCCMKHAHTDCFSRFLEKPDQCFFSKTGCRHDTCFDLTDAPGSMR